jgi:hypothetical protein
MGTRCRGLGEICARMIGPVRGQIETRVQITERKPSIQQIVEIDAADSLRQRTSIVSSGAATESAPMSGEIPYRAKAMPC